MRTKVYIVMESDYHGDEIIEIYANRKKAENRIKIHENEEDDGYYVIQEHDVIL